jgi:glycosyltransferase involved in cell wall biosynthesis
MKEVAPNPSGHVWHGGTMTQYRIYDHRGPQPRPRILVVIPFYNAAPWINECVAKLAMNDEPHDILVVDDGSNPPLDIATSDNLVVCRFRCNAGLVTALNLAASFAMSQGYSYYVRQDADDFSRPDRLRLQREAIEREGADLVVSGVNAVDEDGRTIWSGYMTADERAFRRALSVRNPVVHSTWFMRTDLFAEIGCYDERFKGAEDFELLQRIARNGKIALVPHELVDYLVRPGSVLSASRGPAWQTLRIVTRYFDPARLTSYVGIARATGAAIFSRRLKTSARRILRDIRR